MPFRDNSTGNTLPSVGFEAAQKGCEDIGNCMLYMIAGAGYGAWRCIARGNVR